MSSTVYKLAHFDKRKITAAARKALMVADPHYFAWSTEAQEHFRATMDEKTRLKIECVLLSSLLNIKCSSKEVSDIWNEVPLAEVNMLNWANLLTRGIGDDSIYLNEHLEEGKCLLDFSTLYDYDYASYVFQEQARKQEFPDYKGTDYYAWQHPTWIRLVIDDQFYYASLLSLATHIVDTMLDFGSDYIEQLIPHEYSDGEDHGKPEQGGFLWDFKIDAAGQEAQLDELNSRWHGYQQERWLTLSETNNSQIPAIYTQDNDWDDDPHRFFIFNNAQPLNKIRWRHFLSDCKPFMTDYSTLDEQLIQEIALTKSWLDENHQDIMENFDPNVVKLRKKRKIIMTAEALDDLRSLNGMDDEEEPLE